MSSPVAQLPVLDGRFRLLERYLKHVAVYAFGSWARDGCACHDLDLAIVSDGFAGVASLKRIEIAGRILAGAGVELDLICLTNAEFASFLNSESAFARTFHSHHSLVYQGGEDV